MATRLLVTLVLAVLATSVGHAETWMCSEPEGAIFRDHAGPNCREIYTTHFSTPVVPPLQAVSTPFPATIRHVPILSTKDAGPGVKQAGGIALATLTISHVSQGTGPAISADAHFGKDSRAALGAALAASAKALGYDARYLKVRLSSQLNGKERERTFNGPSAGMMWAVAIASGILGDPLRTDVCLAGTVASDLSIGPVGGLEEKIKGCKQFDRHELILPAGQNSIPVVWNGIGSGVKLTEVGTLGEAYVAATGRPLREVGR